ncbi:MAG: Occludin/ELL family protein [Cyanobacteria bacterium M_surface_10_m2_179]|nr:Occludin/ELL family protein [Cyanobacteria bacterium M_surface_10_m2_179]
MAGRSSLAGAAVAVCMAAGWLQQPAVAGPVVCTTTFEAPQAGSGPVEVTRCGPVVTTPQLVEQRFYSYTSPYARGIDITHQITDILGIAMGGGDGTRVMGFGFPDQTIVWDGSALENTYQVLLEQQSNPMPWRTADVNNGFCQGLPQGSCNAQSAPPSWPQPGSRVLRGLW